MKRRYSSSGRYRLRIAICSFFAGWVLAGFYYGNIPPTAHAQEIVVPPVPPSPTEVICKFEFPPLPIEMLEGK